MQVKGQIARQKNTNKFNMSKQTITTTDFGIKRPIFCNVMFPGDKFVVNIDHLTRLMPMPNPTFGKIKEIIRCFTIPYRTIHKHFNDVLSNNYIYTNGQKREPETHWMYLGDICNEIYTNGNIIQAGSESDYDICIEKYISEGDHVSVDERRYLKYTQRGRHIISLLQGLGYNIPSMQFSGNAEDYEDIAEADTASVANTALIKISLYPLIAFWKSFIDWCIPSRFINDITEIQNALSYFYETNGHVGNENVYFRALINTPPITYNSGDLYFSRAFLNPYGMEQEASKNIEIQGVPNEDSDIANVYANKEANAEGSETPPNGGVFVNTSANLNVASLRTLGALQDMVNRGKLNGTRVKDYLKSTYGIEPSLSELDYSEYLGKRENTIMIGDVMSNSDTKTENGGAYLGEYAGRAIGGGQNENFTIEAKEHQLLIITHELLVENSYMQGLTPETWLIDKMDFFQPEMDGKDMQPITYKELYASELTNREDPSLSKEINLNGTWGWIERYAHFKKNTDTLSGDFRRHSVNEGMESWFLGRKFELATNGYLEWLRGINADFVKQYSETTSENYDKIFMYNGSDVDHFYSVFNFQVDAYRYMRSLETPFEFEEDETRSMQNNFQGNVE